MQAIPHPSGVTVFGSYLIKKEPDRALVQFRVSKTRETAREAFAAAREAADVVDAGADVIDSVDFHTSGMKEIRARARRGAFEAAREKAKLYTEAAGVELGKVLHIEDVNPRALMRGHGEDLSVSNFEDDGEPPKASPGAITVGAAVQATFAIL